MEQELRNKVKEAAKEYYKEIFGQKREFDYIPPSGKYFKTTNDSRQRC